MEQTTPAAHLIFDAAASVSDLTFDDLDLDVSASASRNLTPPPLPQRKKLIPLSAFRVPPESPESPESPRVPHCIESHMNATLEPLKA